MNIGYVNLFLETEADGSVAAVFPGGLTVEGLTPIPVVPLSALFSGNAASWTRGPGGPVIGQLVGSYDTGPGLTQQMNLTVASENGAGSAGIDLQADDFGNGAINLGIPGAGVLTLLNNAGQSSFLQLKAAQNLKVQIFTGVFAAAVGTTTAIFNLPSAWANNHLFVIGSAFDYQSGGAGAAIQFSPNGLAQLACRVWGITVAQNVTATFITFGN